MRAIVYDGVVLHSANTIIRVVLFCVAATLWVLYFHEILFRSGKIQMHWVKKRLADLGLMLLIALVTILITTLISGIRLPHSR